MADSLQNSNRENEYDSILQFAKEEYDDTKDSLDVFEAKDAQLVCYNATTVNVPMAKDAAAAKIVSARMA